MPETNRQKTFTGCWTCRRRSVRCDKATPQCSQCIRMRTACEGYQIRLVWVDLGTGTYIPHQRRAYPCHLTWKKHPPWTLKEVSSLIDGCEKRQFRRKSHQDSSPFGVFPQIDEESQVPNTLNHEELISEPVPGLRQSNNEQTQVDIQSSIFPVIDIIVSSGSIDSSGVYGLHETRAGSETPLEADSFYKTYENLIPYKSTNSFSRQDAIDTTMAIILPPSQTLTPSGNCEEHRLFYHYVCNISIVMTPIDDGHNPWKSTYPSIAVRDLSSSSTRALYHAILAQSAYFLANVKGPVRGKGEKLSAMRYFGMAIRELRESLTKPDKDYISVLAALLTVILGEHVFKATSRGWRNHLQGAVGFVTQYLAQQPWRLSHDAWIITQNFSLSYVIAQTVGSCSETADNNKTDIYNVLCDVMARPGFGYTVGGTARLIKAIYKARQLEEQIAAARFPSTQVNLQDMSKEMRVQVEEIIQQLQIPLNDEVEVIMERHHEPQHRGVVRTRVQLHFHLFNNAVMI
ncbi:hypothetical protein BP6252_13080 [Coleophoma cylindrospora]|uniref:Zn(2)-C6 fungal-type domain-containing protein n=1 Tax=Coleophoma cylindrospora TaxID=1849047 RepID=A0A3D8QAU3_9HELO|nr:hypothetical protein BP6252_13080 [Coleophoma cylindrospora]